ncbi:hypothetical protein [Fusobacterium polymorphum]|jgi:hypothetical protein|uniref:hypothetical protein n=1 Tax=Fusobacterium nucleatum subsp. polymorphum TaxID=76857 RepID=UPI001C6EF73A|nr:hypothetical protein [Fusobacterium polymorphum]QYR58909.1 hypothetical protein JY397_11240 [Fusobacterium polymorphum]DAK96799.1 MAG TPA: hypothetical protein [Caudoviricetes sp.]
MEIWKIILISFIVSIIVDKTWFKLKYKESVYFVVYTFQCYTGNICIKVNSLDLTIGVIEDIKKYIIKINNLDKSEKIIILNIIELKK